VHTVLAEAGVAVYDTNCTGLDNLLGTCMPRR
jgi:hypothetical protein